MNLRQEKGVTNHIHELHISIFIGINISIFIGINIIAIIVNITIIIIAVIIIVHRITIPRPIPIKNTFARCGCDLPINTPST